MESLAVLMIQDEYNTSQGEISIHTKLGKILKENVPDIPVFSTVLQASEQDKQDAQQDGVKLLLPRLDPHDFRTNPSLDWLTFDHRVKYPHLPPKIRCTVGHTNSTSTAAVRIKRERYPDTRVILFSSDIPEDTEYYKGDEKAMDIGKKEDSILEDAQEADVIFSLGNKIFDHFQTQFRAIPASKRPQHVKFVPRPSKIFADAKAEYMDAETMVVLSIGRVKGVEKLKGYDLAAETLSIVADKMRVKWRVIGFNKYDFEATKAILEHCKSANLQITFLPYSTQKDICKEMMQAHLVLMPSRAEPFGLVGLEAIAAGVPVLVSSKSGLADFIHEHVDELHHSIVDMDGSDEGATVRRWADAIEKVLKQNRAEFKTAARGKQQLLSSQYWEEFHLQFIKACTDAGAQHPSEVQSESAAAAPIEEANRIREPLIPEVPGPPSLPIVVEILAQVIPSVKTPEQFLSYASAKTTLVTIDITKDETLHLLKQIKPEIKTIEDLVNTTEAVRQLSNIKGVSVTGMKTGSLVFYLQCTDLSGLGQLWFMYKCGQLNDLMVGSLIREETLQQLHAESVSVKTTINTEDFRKALIYLLTSSSAEGQPISRLPQEYPLYQPHTHTTSSVLDVLHLDDTNLARSSGKLHELHIPPTTQTEDSLEHLGSKLGKLKITDDQQTTRAHNDTDVPQEISELVSLDIRELEQLMGKPRKRTSSMSSQTSGYKTGTPGSGPSRPYSPTGELETQPKLGTLLAELNTAAVMEDKAQQFDLYCQIGDLYRTKLHNLQSALQYYQNMLQCSQELSEDTKQAKAYSRLGLTCDILGFQAEALKNHEKALAIYEVEIQNETNICVAYKNLASSLALSGQVSDAKTNYESALAVAMETGNKTEQMDIYCKLGNLHRVQLHEPQESLKYYTEMLALARDLGRKEEERQAYNKLGVAHYDMREHVKSLEWFKNYLKMSQESGEQTAQITAHQNIAGSYKALGTLDLARSHCQSAMTIAMETGNKTEQITAHKNIADFYKTLGKLDLARSHYQSAMTIAMETGNKTEQMEIYCLLGDLHVHREKLDEPQESLKHYTEMLALARDLGRKDMERLAYNRLGRAHYDMGEHEESLEWDKKNLKMSEESGDRTEQITAHQNISDSYKALGKLELARSHYQSAMAIAMETGSKSQQMDINGKLGNLHREQLHEPQESHKYYTKMLALARDLGRKDKERLAYNKLGVAHYDMGEYETALDWSHKFLKMSQESGDKTAQITAHRNIAYSYQALGKLDLARSHSAMTIAMETGNRTKQMDIYRKLGDLHREHLHEPQESLKYYTEMLALARDMGRKDREGLAYNRLGVAHYAIEEHEAALEWFCKFLKMSQESEDKTGQITAHTNIADFYKALGKLDLARSPWKQETRLNRWTFTVGWVIYTGNSYMNHMNHTSTTQRCWH